MDDYFTEVFPRKLSPLKPVSHRKMLKQGMWESAVWLHLVKCIWWYHRVEDAESERPHYYIWYTCPSFCHWIFPLRLSWLLLVPHPETTIWHSWATAQKHEENNLKIMAGRRSLVMKVGEFSSNSHESNWRNFTITTQQWFSILPAY